MPPDIRDVLRRAAAEPREPLDLGRVRARARRWQLRASGGAAALVLAITVGSVAILSGQRADRPDPGPTAATGARPTARLTPGPSPSPFTPPAGWTTLPAPPQMRHHAATQWTGEALLMWGGARPAETTIPVADGYAFDASTRTWSALPSPRLSARAYPASAWTGRELLVWGGLPGDRLDGGLGDGAAYDPRLRSWRSLPPAPIDARAPLSVWTGEEMIVWGTAVRREQPPRDGAAYRPATDSWRRIADAPIEVSDATAVWTGREMIVFGAELSTSNNAPATPTAIGAAYDPATDTWRRLPDSPLSPQANTAAWTGRELVAWDYQMAAAAYDPDADAWRPLPSVPIRALECYPRSVRVGGRVVGEFCGSMVVYDAGARRWSDVSKADLAGWWLEMVPAGASAFVFGLDVAGGPPRMWAYRPPP
jgi:hypothetical protein